MAYSLDDIKKILEEDGRGITVVEQTFVNTTTNAVFVHPVFGEWTATPKRVVFKKTTHPMAANQLRSTSNLKAREVNPSILDKTVETNLKRYGTRYGSQTEQVKLKAIKTNIERYGKASTLAVKEIREKAKKTKTDRYGSVNFNNRKKSQETCLSRYGVACPTQLEEVKEKILRTKESRGLIVRPRGLSWEELAAELNVPRTSLQSFWKEHGGDDSAIDRFVKLYSSNHSDIEMEIVSELGLEKLNGGVSAGGASYRPDFKISETIYLNVDGLYWHSQKVDRDKKYHFQLRQRFEAEGLRVIQFRANEIKNQMPIVRSIIDNAMGRTAKRVYARKCTVRSVDPSTARQFLKQNHMMGPSNSRFIGLYHGQDLVSVVGFKVKNGTADIDRFASLTGHSVVGALSKLISHICRSEKLKRIEYWVDLRYGTGRSLEKIGFEKSHDVLSWQWTDFKNTYHRSKCRANMDSRSLSQAEHAEELRLSQIYDAGQRLYFKDFK